MLAWAAPVMGPPTAIFFSLPTLPDETGGLARVEAIVSGLRGGRGGAAGGGRDVCSAMADAQGCAER